MLKEHTEPLKLYDNGGGSTAPPLTVFQHIMGISPIRWRGTETNQNFCMTITKSQFPRKISILSLRVSLVANITMNGRKETWLLLKISKWVMVENLGGMKNVKFWSVCGIPKIEKSFQNTYEKNLLNRRISVEFNHWIRS